MKKGEIMKTYCTNCQLPIEFDGDMAGLNVKCPDCGAAVKLHGFASSPLEPAKKTTRPVPPKIPAPTPAKKFSRPTVSIVVFTLIGLGLIFHGFDSKVETAIHQIITGIYIVGGFLMLAVAALLECVASSSNQIWEKISKND